MIYKYAIGHNNHTLTAFSPQPRCAGIQYIERGYGPGGRNADQGKGYAELEFTLLTIDQYRAILAGLGLAGRVLGRVSDAEVSLLLPTDDRYPQFVNAIIDLPRIGPENKFRRGFHNDVVFPVRMIEAMTA